MLNTGQTLLPRPLISKTNVKKLNHRLHFLKPLFHSNLLSLHKHIIFKYFLQLLKVHGISIWNLTKYSNKRTIQTFSGLYILTLTGIFWFISNKSLQSDLKMCSVYKPVYFSTHAFNPNFIQNPTNLFFIFSGTLTTRTELLSYESMT